MSRSIRSLASSASERRAAVALAALGLGLLLGLGGCNEEEVAWETTAGAVGGRTGAEEALDLRWRGYNERVVSALDVMGERLQTAHHQANVVDRAEIARMTDRVAALRGELIAELDAPAEGAHERRGTLEAEFEALRQDLEALLLRLGHSRDEFRAWQDAS